jgi:hypothetical protein
MVPAPFYPELATHSFPSSPFTKKKKWREKIKLTLGKEQRKREQSLSSVIRKQSDATSSFGTSRD